MAFRVKASLYLNNTFAMRFRVWGLGIRVWGLGFGV